MGLMEKIFGDLNAKEVKKLEKREEMRKKLEKQTKDKENNIVEESDKDE